MAQELTGHQPDGPAGPWQAVEPSPACPCGLGVEQPWRTRDDLYSPASFIGGMLWYVAVVAALLWGFPLFGWILAGLLGAVVLGSLVSQAFRRHRGFCWLGRGAWFGIAVPGVPLRALAALPSF